MLLPDYPLISVSALVQGDSLPLMQKVIFPSVDHPVPVEADARLQAFREMVVAFEKTRRP